MGYKRFQKDAIIKILRGYESNDQNNRFLVADEVGLGKTYIAKGVVRCLAYFRYLEEKSRCHDKSDFSFAVLYLCSNLNIAEQNKRKLGVSTGEKTGFWRSCIYGNTDFSEYKCNCDEDTGSSTENRTTMLLKQKINEKVQGHAAASFRKECVEILGEAFVREKETSLKVAVGENDKIALNIIPITPDTSIKIKYGGHIEERTFIRDVLICMCDGDNEDNIRELCAHVLQDDPIWRKVSLKDGEKNKLRELLPDFKEAVSRLLKKDQLSIKELKEEKYRGIADKLSKEDEDTWKKGWELLRKLFALASLELLKYDFVVMDEFQNFNDILQKANRTEESKQLYSERMRYIYHVLCEYDKGNNYEKVKNAIRTQFPDIEEYIKSLKFTNYESNFWAQKLSQADTVPDGSSRDLDGVLECFLEMAKPDRAIKTVVAGEGKGIFLEEKKQSVHQLVKAILCEEERDSRETEITIWKHYQAINPNSETRDLSKIEYLSNGRECTKSAIEVYDAADLRFLPFNTSLLNAHIYKDYMEDQYAGLRDRYPYPLKKVGISKTPFDHLIDLFLKGDCQYLSPNMLLNCFQLFYRGDKRTYIWQYAYILSKILTEDPDRYLYTAEQMEPLRKLLGVSQIEQNEDLENFDEQMLLKHIFQNEVTGEGVTRILMLSATPFKMYDNNDDDVQKNANIIEVCDFLDHNLKKNVSAQLIAYKNALLNYSNSCMEMDELRKAKEAFQEAMSSMFTRMERYAVLRTLNENWFGNMISREEQNQSELGCGQTDRLLDYLKEVKGMNVDEAFLSYAVDSPYIGTFMHNNTRKSAVSDDGNGYEWKVGWSKICSGIDYNEESKVYISGDTFEKNVKPLGLWHGVYHTVLKKVLGLDALTIPDVDHHPGAARLLWVPSCVNKDKLDGVFKEHKHYGKTIIFSRYVQTPRMIACLTSYETRRRLCWWIENRNPDGTEKDPEEFRQYLFRLAKDFDPQKQDAEGDFSTFQCLKTIISKVKDGIKTKITDESETGFLRDYFLNAVRRYQQKYQQKYPGKKEEVWQQNEETDTRLGVLASYLAEAFAEKILLNKEQGLLAIWAAKGFPVDSEDSGADHSGDTTEWFVEDCCRKIEAYCRDGRLEDVLDEWFYICFEADQDFGEFVGLKGGSFLTFVKESRISIDLYGKDAAGKIKKEESNNAVLYFARCIGMSKDDDNISAVKGLQQSFNAPFAPFVFVTTSMGQEGLDFHYYADNVIHWKLPSNPVDFEQREGRINRYHCLAIRKKAIEWWKGGEEENGDIYSVFERAFSNAREKITADTADGKDSKIKNCEMIPDWILTDEKREKVAQINRFVPYFYLSRMAREYNRTLRVLQLYRTVIGQGNPEEIMDRLMTTKEPKEVEELFVDFSPYWMC